MLQVLSKTRTTSSLQTENTIHLERHNLNLLPPVSVSSYFMSLSMFSVLSSSLQATFCSSGWGPELERHPQTVRLTRPSLLPFPSPPSLPSPSSPFPISFDNLLPSHQTFLLIIISTTFQVSSISSFHQIDHTTSSVSFDLLQNHRTSSSPSCQTRSIPSPLPLSTQAQRPALSTFLLPPTHRSPLGSKTPLSRAHQQQRKHSSSSSSSSFDPGSSSCSSRERSKVSDTRDRCSPSWVDREDFFDEEHALLLPRCLQDGPLGSTRLGTSLLQLVEASSRPKGTAAAAAAC